MIVTKKSLTSTAKTSKSPSTKSAKLTNVATANKFIAARKSGGQS
jgi:hypothetical protein